MSTQERQARQARQPWRWWSILGGLAYTLAVLAAVTPWAGFSFILYALQCDDGCSTGQSYWQYDVQGYLTLLGIVLAFGSVAAVWRRSAPAWGWTFGPAVFIAASWALWVTGGGF